MISAHPLKHCKNCLLNTPRTKPGYCFDKYEYIEHNLQSISKEELLQKITEIRDLPTREEKD